MRRVLLAALILPVFAWAAISYAAVGFLVTALREEPLTAVGLLVVWFAISVFLLLALRRLVRGARRGHAVRSY
jgi:hypothetical protein